MTTSDDSLGGRLALLRPDALAADQKKIYDQLQATEVPWAEQAGFAAQTEDHELIGPFNAMLRSPEIATAMMGLTHALGQHSALSERARQVVILTVGAVWEAAYELYAHTAVGRQAGLPAEAIQALAAGQPPVGLSPEETLAHEFTRQVATTHQVAPDLYQRTLGAFGEKGVFDMLVLAGQYMTVSAMLNTMETELAADYVFKYDVLRNATLDLIHTALRLQPAAALHQHANAAARIAALFAELLERQFPIESPRQRVRLRFPVEFADQLAIHVNHLNKALKEATGHTTSTLLAARLTQEAKVLLRHTRWTVSEVAWCLGFEELPHFINFFKKNAQATPKAFRG